VRWEEDYAAQQEEIHQLRRMIKGKARQVAHNRGPRDGDKMAYDHKGGRVEGTIARNVRNAEERLRRIEADPIPRPPKPLRINPDFDPDRLVSHTPLLATGLCKAYGDLALLNDVSLALNRRSRIAIVGPNGCGKSTLLRILAGLEAPDAGEVRLGPSVVAGYLDQDQESLPGQGTVMAAYRGDREGDPEAIKAELLGYGFFTYPDLLKPVRALSIGQQRKLQLALLMAAGANLLLLDEPTNHLSLDVVERFEAALADFPGAIIAISHDRHFLARFAEEVWTIRDGQLKTSVEQFAQV
jgi:macrolide transport system ATP-binding/permease protein